MAGRVVRVPRTGGAHGGHAARPVPVPLTAAHGRSRPLSAGRDGGRSGREGGQAGGAPPRMNGQRHQPAQAVRGLDDADGEAVPIGRRGPRPGRPSPSARWAARTRRAVERRRSVPVDGRRGVVSGSVALIAGSWSVLAQDDLAEGDARRRGSRVGASGHVGVVERPCWRPRTAGWPKTLGLAEVLARCGPRRSTVEAVRARAPRSRPDRRLAARGSVRRARRGPVTSREVDDDLADSRWCRRSRAAGARWWGRSRSGCRIDRPSSVARGRGRHDGQHETERDQARPGGPGNAPRTRAPLHSGPAPSAG